MLSGNVPLRDYRSVLSGLAYRVRSDEPQSGPAVSRQVELRLGTQTLTVDVNVQRVSDSAPIVSVTSQRVDIVEGDTPVQQLLFRAGDLNISDADEENLVSARVELLGENIDSTQEYLSATGFSPARGTLLQRSVLASPADYQVSEAASHAPTL